MNSHATAAFRPDIAPAPYSPAAPPILRRKCACGGNPGAAGECAACREKKLTGGPTLPRKLAIGAAGDAAEREADRAAERVMGMRAPGAAAGFGGEDRPVTLQRRARSGASGAGEAPAIVHGVLASPGRPLDTSTRAFMELRFGRDLSDVRVHSDSRAAESAAAVNATAYTVGQHVVFGAGAYAPASDSGRRLLAHELAHVGQGDVGTMRRRLTVNPVHPSFAPATDPAAALTTAQRFSEMDGLIQALCHEFGVDSGTGEVVTRTRTSIPRADLASGTHPTGCCCLSVLTDAATSWTIDVSQSVGPRNLPGNRVVLSPTTTPVEFGSWVPGGGLEFQGQVPAAGHELCGHAAMEEIGAHPPAQDRTRTDVHDPTVRIENEITTEQGSGAALRGLARDPHRGESVDRVTVGPFPFNGTTVPGLPAGERNKLIFTAEYARTNDSFVDVVGHSDPVGSAAAKLSVSQKRAENVRDHLLGLGVPPTIVPPGMGGAVSRFTRVEGVGDSQPPPAAANHANWRRVEIFMAGFPAGAQTPPSGTPTGVAPHVRAPGLGAVRSSVDPCVRHLSRAAYP